MVKGMVRRGTVTGLDIGTTKVSAIVGEVDEDGEVHIVGTGSVPSVGLRRGVVVDVESTAKASDADQLF